jgi:hypothetical protein
MDAIFPAMRRNLFMEGLLRLPNPVLADARAFVSLCVFGALLAAAGVAPARAQVPPAPQEQDREVPREAPREIPREGRQGYWRNLTPAQRDAIRRLSQEQRDALGRRPGLRPGAGVPPGSRLSAEERRQLRDQIREDHERRIGRLGGRRP